MATEKHLGEEGPPLNYRLESVNIQITRQQGSGPIPMRRITLSGAGNAELIHGAQSQRFQYTTSELIALLNEFYRIRFFNLPANQTTRHSVFLRADGMLVTSNLRFSDAASTNVCVNLADYRKCVTYAGEAPQDLEQIVKKAFAVADRVTDETSHGSNNQGPRFYSGLSPDVAQRGRIMR